MRELEKSEPNFLHLTVDPFRSNPSGQETLIDYLGPLACKFLTKLDHYVYKNALSFFHWKWHQTPLTLPFSRKFSKQVSLCKDFNVWSLHSPNRPLLTLCFQSIAYRTSGARMLFIPPSLALILRHKLDRVCGWGRMTFFDCTHCVAIPSAVSPTRFTSAVKRM